MIDADGLPAIWRSVDAPVGDLPDAVYVDPPRPIVIDEERRGRRRRYWRQFFPDWIDMPWVAEWAREPPDESIPLPKCGVSVVAVESQFRVYLDPPVRLQRGVMVAREMVIGTEPATDENLDELATVIKRWPEIDSVRVQNLTPASSDIAEGLRARGVPAVVSAPELRVTEVAFIPVDHPFTEPLGWHVNMWQPDSNAPSLSEHFGDDFVAMADYLGQLSTTSPIPIHADRRRLDDLAPLLSERQILWDPKPDFRERKARKYVGNTASSGGMSMQLTSDGFGWLWLEWSVGEDVQSMSVSFGLRNGWNDLAMAIRRSCIDGIATYCEILHEPDCSHVVVIADKANGQATVELWHFPDDDDSQRHVRSTDLRARWSGPTESLVYVVAEASKNLIEGAGRDNLLEQWHYPPDEEIQKLTEWLTHSPAQIKP